MRFSVLLPTRNGGSFLKNCINSILQEPYDDMELVVSDNANIDETQSVLKSFASDMRLKVVRLEKAVCVTDNWNNALKASSGDYVLMMGDDDCLLPGYFKRMEGVLKRYNDPDCVMYNGYSYLAPYSIPEDAKAYYKDPFFDYGPELMEEGLISGADRFLIVKDMFDFRNRIPMNMQSTLMSRKAMDRIKGGAFQPPFPDHYALNSLLLTAKSWVFLPEKLLVVGISPKSFGHFIYSYKQEEGKRYLGIDVDFKGRLPGIEFNNCMFAWLSLLKKNFLDELKNIRISRASYVRHQVYSWYRQYRDGALPARELFGRLILLSPLDWFHLFTFFTDSRSLQRLSSLFRSSRKNKIQNIWNGARPLENISTIKEFADLISREQVAGREKK